MPRPVLFLAIVAVLVAGCGAGTTAAHRQPEAVDDGVQATGRIDGRLVAISDGAPETNLQDCGPGPEPDHDVCWIARTIDGLAVAFVIENPGALVPGERLAVRPDRCTTCQDVTTHAVVDLLVDGQQQRASSGFLLPSQVGDRYAASFDVRFPGGDELRGRFNIRELLPHER